MQLWKMMSVGELCTETIIPTLFSYLLHFSYSYILLHSFLLLVTLGCVTKVSWSSIISILCNFFTTIIAAPFPLLDKGPQEYGSDCNSDYNSA